jgi:GT2 family glycosyltransferase
VVDELSTDGTPDRLSERQVHTVQPDQPHGVTHNWNMAWRSFLNSSHSSLFIINNDVLIPDGVLDKLARALDPHGAHAVLCCAVLSCCAPWTGLVLTSVRVDVCMLKFPVAIRVCWTQTHRHTE